MTKVPGRPQAAADIQNRQRLLDAARQCFSQQGYAASTTRTIAAAAGTNPALIRYYFGNKAGLFQAVLQETLQPMLKLMQAITQQRQAPDLLVLIQQYHQMMAPHPELPLMLFRALHNPASAEYSMVSQVFEQVIGTALTRLLQQLTTQNATVGMQQHQTQLICALALAVFPFLMPQLIRQILQFEASASQLQAIVTMAAPLFNQPAVPTTGEQHV